MKDTKTNRRNLLKNSALLIAPLGLSTKAIGQVCGLTPQQTEGPFYPVNDQIDKDADLTFMTDRNKSALGEVIIIQGKVIDENCGPVENAIVEIWQACATGKYNHPGDPNPASLDPNFQYWGRALTNKDGEYQFKTIRPGHYQATSTWMRPAHIHFKVHRRGYVELTSQLYFKDDIYNANDRILQSLSPAEQKLLVVDFKNQLDQFRNKTNKPKLGKFDISIESL